MGYPETAEGFMVNDQKNWTKFEKKEVRGCLFLAVFQPNVRTDTPSVPSQALRGPRH
jgi:hypothetical protein